MTRDPALFAEIQSVPWDELPPALDAYVERVEARAPPGEGLGLRFACSWLSWCCVLASRRVTVASSFES